MNAAQVRLVFSWIIWALLLTILLLSARWLFEKWYYMIFLLFLGFLFGIDRDRRIPYVDWNRGEWSDSEFAQEHPFVLVWLIIYVLLLFAAIFWVLMTDFDVLKHFGPAGLLLPILGLAAPAVVARQLDEYRVLAVQSNPTVESDARKSGARGAP